eukprot:6634752-Prymnesium_polylepis.2
MSQKVMTPEVRIRVSRDAYSPKPELWLCKGVYHLVLPGTLITSKIREHGVDDDHYYVKTTSGSTYSFDWAPTLRRMSRRRLQEERLLITQRIKIHAS